MADNEKIKKIALMISKIKKKEMALKTEREELESEILTLIPLHNRGTKTHNFDDFNVKIALRESAKIDEKIWATVKDKIDRNMWPVKEVIEVDMPGVRYLSDNEPKDWAKIAKAFTIKSGKTGVEIILK